MSVEGSLDELTASLRPGQTIFIPGAVGEPIAFLDTLAGQPERATGVHFVSNCIPGINEFDFLDRYPESQLTCFFMQERLGKYAATARLNYVPITYFEIDQYLQSSIALDLAIVQVSPPDRNGQVSLGSCVEFNPTVLRAAKTRVALINEYMPFLPHSHTLHIGDFDRVIVANKPLRYVPTPAGDALGERIAQNVASLVREGDTLQTGIGKLPAQVLRALRSHRGLRVHSGIVAQEVAELVGCGAIDMNSPIVCATFAADSAFLARADYAEWLELRPISYTHNPATLAGIDNLVAINSAIEVDLRGQVNAEVANGRVLSGPGGMPDFATAAHRALHGRSIIALPSTTPAAKASRIVTGFGDRAGTSLTRNLVDYVVTEFGVAQLRNKNQRQRALALIDIAHPDFRTSLHDEFFQ